jgi:hypothetical protein
MDKQINKIKKGVLKEEKIVKKEKKDVKKLLKMDIKQDKKLEHLEKKR